MVFVRMGNDQTQQRVPPFGDENGVGHHHIHLGMLRAAKSDAAIHRQPTVAPRRLAAIEIEIHTDFARSAQRQERKVANRRVHEILSMPHMSSALYMGYAARVEQFARYSGSISRVRSRGMAGAGLRSASIRSPSRVRSGRMWWIIVVPSENKGARPPVATTFIGAPQAVLEAAGGSVCNVDGTPLLYGKAGWENPHFVCSGQPPSEG